MKSFAQLRHAYKFSNITYPHKNSLSYASFIIGGDNGARRRWFSSKTSGGEPNGDEGVQEAFAVLSLLRDNSRQVELISEPKIDCTKDGDKENLTEKSVLIAKDNEGYDKNNLYDIEREITPRNPSVNPTMEINEIPISGMDTEMINLKKSLLNPNNLLKLGNLNASTLSLSTNTRLEPYDTTTIPLHLNTFINGIVDVESKKGPQYELQSLKVPEFNEYLTSLAANLCSAAFQNTFSGESCRKYYCTENTIDGNYIQKSGYQKTKKVDPSSDEAVEDLLKEYDEFQSGIKALATSSTVTGKGLKNTARDPHIICVGDEKRGCISPGNKGNPPYIPKKATDPGKTQEKKGKLGLLDPQLYKKALKEAENKRKEHAKASASRNEKSSQRACQSKQSRKETCKSTASKCGLEMQSVKNFESLTEPSSPFKCGSRTTETKCESKKMTAKNPSPGGFSKCTSETKPICQSSKRESKDPCKISQSANQDNPCQPSHSKSKCSSKERVATCESENPEQKDPCKVLPKISSKQNLGSRVKASESNEFSKTAQKSESVPKQLSKCGTEGSAENKTQGESFSQSEKKSTKCENSDKVAEHSKCSPKSEPKPETSLKCSSSSELKLEDPCKILPIRKSKSCGSSSETEDPCKVVPITFDKSPGKSPSASKCSVQSTPKSEARKEEQVPSSTSMTRTSVPSSKCSQPSKPISDSNKSTKCGKSDKVTENSKCSPKSEPKPETSLKCSSNSELKLEDPCKILPIRKSKSCGSSSETEDPCKVLPITFDKSPGPKCEARKEEQVPSSTSMPSTSVSDSKCSEPTKPICDSKPDKSIQASKCSSSTENKCSSSSSCIKSQQEPTESDSEKACKRAGMDAKAPCDSQPKNPCKSKCDSMAKPKSKCGRPPRGDTRPRCKKDSTCGSKKPSPCASKEKSESKCGTELTPPEEPSKCGSKTCAPSPKTSKTEIKPKSTNSSGHTKPKIAPSSEPPKRNFHSLSNFSISNLILSRNLSDDCPEKPKGGYKLESEKSDEYRRETCDNFSWKATKSRMKRTNKPKNCYPEETQEFCPDTACYKVYAETSGKSNKKSAKKRPKANKMEKKEALCIKTIIGSTLNHQKRHLSSKVRENEEALIQKPHSICTTGLTLPDICDNDASICVDSVALSDSDIYMFETGGRHTPELTLGNEAAGVVTEVGRNICNLKPGDHVVLESGVPCFKCDLCKMGRYNLCNKMSFKGFLKNHCIHPASFCHKICPPIPLERAALIPQLALGCNACYQAGIKPSSNVAIIGSCAKTVCAAICAISMGAENVCVMCGMPETRILIEQFVTEKVDSFDCNTIEIGIVRMILASLGTLPDIVINFSASTKTMNAAIMALSPTGTCTIAGCSSECVSYNIMEALMKEIRIVPSFRSKNMFPKAIHLLESGRAPLDCLIANCELCKWNELESAFKLALSEGNNGPRKAIVKCQLTQ